MELSKSNSFEKFGSNKFCTWKHQKQDVADQGKLQGLVNSVSLEILPNGLFGIKKLLESMVQA